MTKVNNRVSYPALDNSKPVKNPDLLNIADKNYTDTILKYAGLATKFPQLETNAKQIVPAINEVILKPATADKLGGIKVGERLSITEDGILSADEQPIVPATTESLGGVIVGDGLSVTEEGILSANPQGLTPATENKLGGIKIGTGLSADVEGVTKVTSPTIGNTILYQDQWSSLNDVWVYELGDSSDWREQIYYPYTRSNYNAGPSMDSIEWVSCGIHVRPSTYQNYQINQLIAYRKPTRDIRAIVISWPKVYSYSSSEVASISPPSNCKIYDITLYANSWNASSHIYHISIDYVTPNTDQIILPVLVASQSDIANNISLQEANIQDAGQGEGWIRLYAENIPTQDLQIRVVMNG